RRSKRGSPSIILNTCLDLRPNARKAVKDPKPGERTELNEEDPVVKILRGVIHGRTIRLETELGVEEGRRAEGVVRSKALPGPPPGWQPGGTETAAGVMADHRTEEDDRIFEEIAHDRHRPSPREIPE